MKRKIIALSLALITAFSLAACQKTPEQEFVVQKDTERMIEQARDEEHGTTAAELGVPEENYTFSATGADGRLVVNVDAPVIVPSANIPTARVSATGFTQEQVTGFFNYLFPGEKPLSGTNVLGVTTKAEIQETIIQYKRYLSEGTVEEHTLYTPEELEEEIKRLEKELEAAPDDASLPQGTVSDGTMAPGIWRAGNSEERTFELDVADDKAHLYVRTPGNENQHAAGYLQYSTDIEDVNYYEGSLTKITSEDASDKVSISYDHALQLCNEFFAAGKVDDVVLGKAFLVQAGEAYAYRFDFVHDVNGAPAAWIRHTAPPDDDYALPWQYERIDIMVDGNGINAIFWQEPTLTGEILSEDTKIISFDEAGKVFEKMILASYEAQTTLFDTERNISIDISQIQLAPIRIREVNAQGRNGIYVPAWIFYGSLKEDIIENSTVSFSSTTGSPEEPHIMLAVNAIDGSIIDLDRGY